MKTLLAFVTALIWVVIAVSFWVGAYEPSWWFVGVSFSMLALSFIIDWLEKVYR